MFVIPKKFPVNSTTTVKASLFSTTWAKYSISLWLDFLLKLIFKHQPVFRLPIFPKRSDLYQATLEVFKHSKSAFNYFLVSILVAIPFVFLISNNVYKLVATNKHSWFFIDYFTALGYVILISILILFVFYIAVSLLFSHTEKRVINHELAASKPLLDNYQPNLIEGKIEYKIAQLINATTNKEYPNFFVIFEWLLLIIFLVSLVLSLHSSNQYLAQLCLLINIISIYLYFQLLIVLKAYNQAIILGKLKVALNLLQQLGWEADATRIQWSARWIYTSQALIPEWFLDSEDVMLKQFVQWLYKTPIGKQNMAVFQDEDKWPTPYWLYRNLNKNSSYPSVILSYLLLFLIYFQFIASFVIAFLTANFLRIDRAFEEILRLGVFFSGLAGFSLAIIQFLFLQKRLRQLITETFYSLYRQAEDGLEFINDYFFASRQNFRLLPTNYYKRMLNPTLVIIAICIIFIVANQHIINSSFTQFLGIDIHWYQIISISITFGLLIFTVVYGGLIFSTLLLLRALERYYTVLAALNILKVLGWDQAEYRISTPRKY